jgi:transposase
LDKVRKAEYRRRKGKDRQFIKGQQYTLLSRRAHLTLEGRQALQKVLAANKRLHTAYLLKESFAQLWRYQKEGWARRFFDHT